MFIKTMKKQNRGYTKVSTSHRLMESYRTPQGKIQITLFEGRSYRWEEIAWGNPRTREMIDAGVASEGYLR
jgi:hypothetical protein